MGLKAAWVKKSTRLIAPRYELQCRGEASVVKISIFLFPLHHEIRIVRVSQEFVSLASWNYPCS